MERWYIWWRILVGIFDASKDPVRSCDSYKEHGCAHVDGMFCDMKTCMILENYNKAKNENILCPVCGYYCNGHGGLGCIDKPSLQ